MSTKRPLDESLYHLDHDELTFFRTHTGIDNDEDLKSHILSIQAKAYDIYGYPCIRKFSFTKLKISRLPAYGQVLNLGRERRDAILLDIGCCFGEGVRKVIDDGYPMQNVIASDLRQEFWDLGHELFKSTPESFPVPFIPGDAFDPNILVSVPPFYDVPSTPIPSLSSLSSLTPLHGHISAIHTSSFFHLFSEERQLQLAQALASLLYPLPGSLILGIHLGLPERGNRPRPSGSSMFCHSPDSWRDLWDGIVFKKGTVDVQAKLKDVSNDTYLLIWSVTRL